MRITLLQLFEFICVMYCVIKLIKRFLPGLYAGVCGIDKKDINKKGF